MVLDFGMFTPMFNASQYSGDGFGVDPATAIQIDVTQPCSPPIGSIQAWAKTFGYSVVDSGTTDSTQAGKLADSTQNFLTTVKVGYVVKKTTAPVQYAVVTAVDSNVQLSLNVDIIITGQTYEVYRSITLNDQWVECYGQTLNDPASIYNGLTIPNLNNTASFLMGNGTSGATGGSSTHSHNIPRPGFSKTPGTPGYDIWYGNNATSDTQNHLPPYYAVVWIMRVK